jgi:hypothetical protein
MIILLVVAAAIITGAPLAAVVLVTIASLREDAGRTLTSRAPNWIDAAARRLLSFQSAGPARGGSRGVDPPGQHGRAARRAPRRRPAGKEAATRPLTGPRA